MTKNLISALAIALAVGSAANAANTVELNDANTQQIRELLIADGYEVAKIKIEDGLYEAYAKKGGQKFEIFLNGDFEVVRSEIDN